MEVGVAIFEIILIGLITMFCKTI